MTRPLRIGYPGALYHLTERGNAELPFFWTILIGEYFSPSWGMLSRNKT